jgi:DNA-binding transcriptional MerR regulator
MADALHPDSDATVDDRFRSIGEAAAETGVKPHILRYWEECFAQLSPMKRAGGRRHYRRADLDLIRLIDDLVNRQGYTFAGARAVLAGDDAAPTVTDSPIGLTPHQRQGLLSLRGDLSAMLAVLRQR